MSFQTSKLVRPSFIFSTQIKIFWIKSESSQTLHKQLFLAHKKYSSSFIKLWFNHWCHMDCFNNVLTTFLDLVSVAWLSMKNQKVFRFNQKYLHLCTEDERRSYGFGTTWGWIINDRIFIFGWNIPFRAS